MGNQSNREIEIFNSALEQATPAERAAYLDGACGDDAELRARIEALIRAHEQKNARTTEALAGHLADAGWDVKGFAPKVEAALPEAYKLDSKARIIRKAQ